MSLGEHRLNCTYYGEKEDTGGDIIYIWDRLADAILLHGVEKVDALED